MNDNDAQHALNKKSTMETSNTAQGGHYLWRGVFSSVRSSTMTDDDDDVTRQAARVAGSRERILNQEAIVARLHGQGHGDLAVCAEELLLTMYSRLNILEATLGRYIEATRLAG